MQQGMFLVSALRTSVRATAVPQLARGLVTSPAHRGLEEFIAHPLKEGEKYTSGMMGFYLRSGIR